jgi:hypothetical protein
LLTGAPDALIKEPKSSKFDLEKNITYTLKKWLHKFQDNFTTFGFLTSARDAMFIICHIIKLKMYANLLWTQILCICADKYQLLDQDSIQIQWTLVGRTDSRRSGQICFRC